MVSIKWSSVNGLVVKFSVAIRNVGEPWVRFPDYALHYFFPGTFWLLWILRWGSSRCGVAEVDELDVEWIGDAAIV